MDEVEWESSLGHGAHLRGRTNATDAPPDQDEKNLSLVTLNVSSPSSDEPELRDEDGPYHFQTFSIGPGGPISTISSSDGFYGRTFYPANYEFPLPRRRREEREALQAMQNLTGYEFEARGLYQRATGGASNRHRHRFSAASRTISPCNNAPFFTADQLDKIAPPVLLIAEEEDEEGEDDVAVEETQESSGLRQMGRRIKSTAIACAHGINSKIRPTRRRCRQPLTKRVILDSEKDEVCVICLEPWGVPGCVIRTLFCNHTFHSECIQTWCARNARCPIDNLELAKWRDY